MNEAPQRQLDNISWHSRLSLRIVVVFLGLLVLVQAVTLALVRTGIDTNARDNLSDQLNLGEQVLDRKSTRLNSSHIQKSRMPSSA